VWFLGCGGGFVVGVVGVIALHKITQNLVTGGTIISVQVALLLVSNYSLQWMDGTHGLSCLLYKPPLNSITLACIILQEFVNKPG
jgi:hypothetical protein